MSFAWVLNLDAELELLRGRPGYVAQRKLVARYWHFMLAVWLGLYALLHWLTPEAARFICGVA